MGGKIDLLPNIFVDEIIPNLPETGNLNGSASFHQDIRHLLSLWTDGSVGASPGTLRTTRSKPFEPFVDEGIMTEDQGVPDLKKKICQGLTPALYEYVRTGRLEGCRDLV